MKTPSLEEYFNAAKKIIADMRSPFCIGFNECNRLTAAEKSGFYDLVTKHDKNIENQLIERLTKAFPNSKFIAEESQYDVANTANLELPAYGPTWIIDPIDGTANFVHQNAHCCISVALAIGKQVLLGIVYKPLTDQMFTAMRDRGAYLNDRPLHVSTATKLADAMLVYEISLMHNPGNHQKHLKNFLPLVRGAKSTRSYGSAALTLCYVAAGYIDAYIVETLNAWDVAAGVLIVNEAKGHVCDINGKQLNILKPDLIAACTEDLKNNLVRVITDSRNLKKVKVKDIAISMHAAV